MVDKSDDKEKSKRELSKAEQLRLRRANRGSGDVADWGGVDGKLLVDAVAAAGANGWGLTLSYTRDGGAYAIFVLGDDSFKTEYVRPTEDIDLYLRNLAEDLWDISGKR